MPVLKIRTAFTLVELLVVIAIITILAGMLLPTLQQAQDAGRKAYCANNLKQIGVAYLSYADDFAGLLPAFAPAGYPSGSNVRFTHLLSGHLDIPNGFYGQANFNNLLFNHRKFSVLTCSASPTTATISYMQSNRNCGQELSSSWPAYYTNLTKITNASQALPIFEAWRSGSVQGDMINAISPWNCHSLTAPGRNAAFLDGHVAFLLSAKYDFLAGNTYFPGQLQGRNPTWLDSSVLDKH